jgi:23S rRNA (uridine2552-2'-O)-methyltransferase
MNATFMIIKRQFSLYSKVCKDKVSSSMWLERQKRDPYVKRAIKEVYRARSAFKLIEIDDKYKILNFGDTVVDIGAAPGSWSQVAVKRTNSDQASI